MVTTINVIKGGARKAAVAWIILVAALGSCKQDKDESQRLSDQEFSALLTEFYMAEARLSFVAASRDSAMKLFIPFESSYLKKHNISEDVLKNTYRYYLDHPAELGKVYDAVIDTLSLREHRTGNGAVRL